MANLSKKKKKGSSPPGRESRKHGLSVSLANGWQHSGVCLGKKLLLYGGQGHPPDMGCCGKGYS